MTSRVAASAPKVTSSRGHNCAISQQAFVLDEAGDDGQTEEQTEEQAINSMRKIVDWLTAQWGVIQWVHISSQCKAWVSTH